MEIRRNPDGTVDEIVAHGATVHLEQMDSGLWFLYVEQDGQEARCFLASKRKIAATVDVEKSLLAAVK